ncbi:putative transcription factor WD40-like family [Helianthus annuus]|nr:putative transcription factor WD40-like family [Helianthus annuus]
MCTNTESLNHLTHPPPTPPQKPKPPPPPPKKKKKKKKRPWGALSPMPETNAIAVDTQGGSIYAAAGDSCAYSWDVEKSKIKMTFKGHAGYLHSVVARNSCNQVICVAGYGGVVDKSRVRFVFQYTSQTSFTLSTTPRPLRGVLRKP